MKHKSFLTLAKDVRLPFDKIQIPVLVGSDHQPQKPHVHCSPGLLQPNMLVHLL